MEQSDFLVYGVMVGAFVIGYLVVGFVIKHLKALKERPPLNEELWREQEKAETARRGELTGDDSPKPEAINTENDYQAKQE